VKGKGVKEQVLFTHPIDLTDCDSRVIAPDPQGDATAPLVGFTPRCLRRFLFHR
jgi:hypothetical protein